MSKFRALLIPFDDDKPVEVVQIDGLDDIYKYVAPDSRMFEVLGSDKFDLLLDEEGGPMMRNDAGDRINARAMELYADAEGVGFGDFMVPLCGDYLAAGPVDRRGEMTDVPQEVIDFPFSWRIKRDG
jgi:hypothetical protein